MKIAAHQKFCNVCNTDVVIIYKNGKTGGYVDRRVTRLRQHACTHLMRYWSCPDCGPNKNFTSREYARRHMADDHKKKGEPDLSIPYSEFCEKLEAKIKECYGLKEAIPASSLVFLNAQFAEVIGDFKYIAIFLLQSFLG